MLPMASQHLSRCQRQISECCNDSLELCFLDDCDTDGVAVDYDGDKTDWDSGYRSRKKVSYNHNDFKLPGYSIFTYLYTIVRI